MACFAKSERDFRVRTGNDADNRTSLRDLARFAPRSAGPRGLLQKNTRVAGGIANHPTHHFGARERYGGVTLFVREYPRALFLADGAHVVGLQLEADERIAGPNAPALAAARSSSRMLGLRFP